MTPRRSTSEHDWIATPGLRPDFRGPVERPFVPFADPAVSPSVLEILRRRVAEHPHAIAVESDGLATSYERLWRAAVALAGDIEQAGGGRGPVGILLPGDASYVAAVFACLLAGRVCVLLDDAYPLPRTGQIARQATLQTLICRTGFTPAGDWPAMRLVGVRPGPLATGDAAERAGPRIGLDDPAFILCTSGSTGQPKAIAHSQRTMLHWARTTHEALHVRADDRVLSLSSLSTLGGLTGLLNFLLAGVCVQMCDVRASGLGGLLATLSTRPVTLFRAAPSLMKSLVRVPEAAHALRGLRAVQTYGEPLLKADLQAWRPLLPAGCLLRTTYGSTEASGASWFAGDDDEHDPIRVAAGVLMPDTLAAIVDEQGTSCARGEVGELLVRSRYNALGEWTDGRVDTGMFLPHDADDDTRIFATGDLARCDPEGVFVVLGRRDRMAKVNGQRLDPSEIERVLRGHDGVEEAEVAIVGSPGRVFAFVRLAEGASPDAHVALRSALRGALPAFMVPSRILEVPSMPRLPGGKVDTLALQRLGEQLQASETAPATPPASA